MNGMTRLEAERAGEIPGAEPCPKCEFTITGEACHNRQEIYRNLAQHHACVGVSCKRWTGPKDFLQMVSAIPVPAWLKDAEKEDDPMEAKHACKGCGTQVWPTSTWCRKCSAKQRGNNGNSPWKRKAPTPAAPAAPPTCKDCGEPVSKRGVERCNPCARKHRWGDPKAKEATVKNLGTWADGVPLEASSKNHDLPAPNSQAAMALWEAANNQISQAMDMISTAIQLLKDERG